MTGQPQPSPTVVLAGGSGFLGSAIASALHAQGYEVVTLTRSPRSQPPFGRDVAWDGKNAGDWYAAVEGAAAVINMTGRNVDCRHTDENLAVIRSSRVDATRAVGAAILAAATPPPVWVQGSAIGYYGDVRDEVCTEETGPGDSPLAKVTVDWEAAVPDTPPQTRVCFLRTGMVLGKDGALPRLAKVTKLFLGGTVGDGGQYMSWIHVDDIVGIVQWFLNNDSAAGHYNAVSPTPPTNKDFMSTLRKVLNRPWSPPAPAFAVRIGAALMGTAGSLALDSTRAVPERLLAQGFQFKFADLEGALRDLL